MLWCGSELKSFQPHWYWTEFLWDTWGANSKRISKQIPGHMIGYLGAEHLVSQEVLQYRWYCHQKQYVMLFSNETDSFQTKADKMNVWGKYLFGCWHRATWTDFEDLVLSNGWKQKGQKEHDKHFRSHHVWMKNVVPAQFVSRPAFWWLYTGSISRDASCLAQVHSVASHQPVILFPHTAACMWLAAEFQIGCRIVHLVRTMCAIYK